jgi:hypothetical protein
MDPGIWYVPVVLLLFVFFFDESKKALASSDVGKPYKLLILRQHA